MAEGRWINLIWIILGSAVAVWLLVAFGLGILLPFLLGYLTARLAEPLVCRMESGSRLPRWLCSGLCVTIVLLLLGLLFGLLGRILFTEAAELVKRVPDVLLSLEQPLQALKRWLLQLAQRAPDGLGLALQAWVERLFTGGSGILEKGSALLLTAATWVIGALPDLVLFLVTAVLSGFMISSRLSSFHSTVENYLPRKWQQHIAAGIGRLKNALGGWVKAQLKLMGITFLILTAGLFLLGIEFPVLLAGVLALIDALPVLGIGTALIPWALLAFLRQDTYLGIGLLLLYGGAALTRTSLEPRLIGKQIGLPPLATLLAMYAGYRLCGLLGMILFPVAAILLQQFLELWAQAGEKKPGS